MENLDIILQSSSEAPEAVLIGGGAVLTSYLIGRTAKINRSRADINRSLTDDEVEKLLEKADDSEDYAISVVGSDAKEYCDNTLDILDNKSYTLRLCDTGDNYTGDNYAGKLITTGEEPDGGILRAVLPIGMAQEPDIGTELTYTEEFLGLADK